MMENWTVPCNPKYFDIVSYLKSNNEIAFKKLKSVNIGDVVYIYISGEIGQIKYRGTVIDNNCDSAIMEKHSYALAVNSYGQPYKYMLIRIDKEFPDGLFPYQELKANGLGQVQVQARLSRQLREYIKKKESEL